MASSDLISDSHLSSNREGLCGRQEGHDVLVGDMRGHAVTSVVISGSTAVGAAQAILDPLSPAADKCKIWAMGKLNLVTLEHFKVRAAWSLGMFVMLGNFLFIQGNIQFPFPVLKVEHHCEGVPCVGGVQLCYL